MLDDRPLDPEPAAPSTPEVSPRTTGERFVVFTVADDLFAIPALRLLELGELPSSTPLPRVPPWIRGLASLRGDLVAVVDLALYWGREAPESGRLARWLVVGSGRGQPVAGVVSERVLGVSAVPPAALSPPPAGAVSEVFASFQHSRGTVQILDLDRLLAALVVGRTASGPRSGVSSMT